MTVRRTALIAYPAESMFDLIEAAEHYPEFLPWCAGATILERTDAMVAAEIMVDYHGVRFTFTTRNPKRRPDWLAVKLERGPFRRFDGEWHITPLALDACKVAFDFHYEMGGGIGRLAAPVFDRIANNFVDAFVARAEQTLRPSGEFA
jgi:ribosome-associated toxin RatA of RatAB toxin-antitoxin module